MGKKKCASGGMIHSPKSMQEQLADIRPKFADGGKVDPAEEMIRRMEAKYGTVVSPLAPQAPVAPPATSAQQPERGLLSLHGKIQQRNDEVQRVMDYDKPRGMAAGGIPGIDEPVSLAVPAPFRQDIGAGAGATALQSGNIAGLPAAAGATPQSQGFIGAPDYSTGPKQTGFTWDDGTRRDGLTPEQAQKQDAQAIASPVPAATAAPLMTMAEKQIAQGINPNAAYRPGGPGDPHASGGLAATAQQRAALPDATQAQPMPAMPANPMDSPSRRSRGRQQFADGGSVYPQERKPRDDYEVPKTFMGHVQKIGGLVGRMVDEIRNPVQHAQTQSSPLDVEAQIMKRAHANAQARDSYADGGMVKFAGKGGPRDDKIPVKVAGENIRVSDGESAVILPAKTAANPQAVQAIGQVIQQSNDGRAPDMGIKNGGNYKDGELTPAQLAAQLYQEKTGQPAPVGANPLPASRGVTGSFQAGASGDIPLVDRAGQVGAPDNAKTDPGKYPYTGQAAQNPYQAASLAGMVSAVTPTAQTSTKPVEAPTPSVSSKPAGMAQEAVKPSQALAVQPWWAGTDTRNESSGLEQERARVAAGQSLSDNLRELNGPSMLTSAVFGEGAKSTQRSDPQQATFSNKGRPSAVQQTGMAAQAIAATPDPRIAANTGNAGNAKFNPDTGTLAFTNPGFDVTKQQIANGTGMISRSNGQTQVIANMSPNQYTAADGTQNARWEQTQQYIDAQARLQADKARAAEMQATRQGMNHVQAIAATQGMAQAAQRAPLDRAVVQQQIETGKVAAQNAKELQDLYALHKASTNPDEQERIAEQIRMRIGKDKPEEFAHAAGGTTINPATMGVEKTPDVIYSKRTGKPVGSTAVASKAFSKSDVDAAISAGASKEAVAARIKSMGMNPKDYGL